MYTSIYAPLDNSDHSNTAMNASVALSAAMGARVTGSHIYAAALHDVRFKQMEFTLPDEYKEENELEKQRRIHDTLITRGLQLISDSYLEPMARMAEGAGVEFEGKTFDGKNFELISQDINESDYDLVVMGALGIGAVKPSKAGSVCERTLRRIKVDALVIRNPGDMPLEGEERITVALDGSTHSWGALKKACGLAKLTGRDLEVIAIHEPGAAGEELLDAHMTWARRVVRDQDIKVSTTTLDGDAPEVLLKHLSTTAPWLIVLGRQGIDAVKSDGDLGSLPESLIRYSPSNILVTGSTWQPQRPAGLSQGLAA